MADEVVLNRQGPVAVITLNRPAKRNAMDGAMARALVAALDETDADPDVVVAVLTGAGGTFCAGMDLAAFLTGDVPEIPGRGLGGLTRQPPKLPLIAAVEGFAVAGGLELALSCDLIVASSAAQFGLPEVTLGLIAGAGGLLRLPERIPAAIALEYALTGDRFGAAVAERWGLVNHVTEPGQALDKALDLAGRIAANGPAAVRLTKQVATEGRHWPSETRWEQQQVILEQVRRSAEAREGAQAFAEHRRPKWTNR